MHCVSSTKRKEGERGSVGGMETVHRIHQSRFGRPLGTPNDDFETVDILVQVTFPLLERMSETLRSWRGEVHISTVMKS